MISNLIQKYKLSVIHASIEEPEVNQVWHVISPHVREKQPRITATRENLYDAVMEVVSQLERV